jgi:hypothetical protein
MTAILLLALLLAGTATYIKWGIHAVAQGISPWWFVAGAPVAYLAPVILLVTAWFAVSWIWRTPRPPHAQLDFVGSVRLFSGEVLAVAISWPLMALHRLVIRDPAPAAAARLASCWCVTAWEAWSGGRTFGNVGPRASNGSLPSERRITAASSPER